MIPSGKRSALPYGLMRLSDLINCSVLGLGTFCSQLMNELTQVRLHLLDTEDYSGRVPDHKANKVQKWLFVWLKVADEFEWAPVSNAITRLEGKLRVGTDYRELDYGLRAIQDAVNDGLSGQLVYRYPSRQAALLEAWKADWSHVIARFPECDRDIFAAVDLWALGHHTASVFHMMRVLEFGLAATAAEVKLSFTIENWQNIIDQIEKQIRVEQKNLQRGEAKKVRLQFLGEAAKEFSYFKDGWRNYVSHNKVSYDEHQARSVLEHVRQFMTVLAATLPASTAEVSDPEHDQTLENSLQHQAPERLQ